MCVINMLQTVEMWSAIITDLQTIAVETCSIILSRPSVTSAEKVQPSLDCAILEVYVQPRSVL